jgi:protein-tyrosine phosphatase
VPGTLVTLPCGSCVRAAASYHRREVDPERDFGLYLDPHWAPSWPAEVVAWENLGLPHDFEAAAQAIRSAYERARRGERIEIGCQAGIGRTGTVLACMAVLAGVAPADAVAWVRANYLERAVETRAQEWWVAWFAGWLGVAPRPEARA